MFCIKCGTELEDGANFCIKCGAPCDNDTSSGTLPETGTTVSRGPGVGVTSTGNLQALSRSRPTNPLRFLAMLISAGLVIFVVYVSLQNLYCVLYCDLSGTYTTYDFFPVTEIAFQENGSFTAEVSGARVVGKYRKKSLNSQTYTLTVTDLVGNSDGNPVTAFQSYEFIQDYELSAEKFGEDMLGIMLVPELIYIDYVGWAGTIATFYKQTEDISLG